MTAIAHDAVAIRAYHAWEDEGRPHGRHEQHWFAAEAAERSALTPAVTVSLPVEAVVQPAPVAVKAAPVKRAAPAKKAAPAAKPAPAKEANPAKAAAPKAPAETVVAAAALKAPRAARAGKGARSTH